jgi:hypothetical protein
MDSGKLSQLILHYKTTQYRKGYRQTVLTTTICEIGRGLSLVRSEKKKKKKKLNCVAIGLHKYHSLNIIRLHPASSHVFIPVSYYPSHTQVAF